MCTCVHFDWENMENEAAVNLVQYNRMTSGGDQIRWSNLGFESRRWVQNDMSVTHKHNYCIIPLPTKQIS